MSFAMKNKNGENIAKCAKSEAYLAIFIYILYSRLNEEIGKNHSDNQEYNS